MNLTRHEQETIINFNEGEAAASIYTHNGALRRRLEKLAQERPNDCRLFKTCHDGRAVEYYIPKSWLRINPPRVAAPLTEEQKQQRREILRSIRESKNSA